MAVIPIQHYKLARTLKGIDRLFPSISDMRKEASSRIKDWSCNAVTQQRITRHLALRCKEAAIFSATRKELLATCASESEKEELLKKYLRIPQAELNSLRKLSQNERMARLLVLLEQYKGGNGGHDKYHLDRTNYGYNPYHLDQRKDHLGLRRRPQFIYDAIDKLLLAVLFPERYKDIFFHKTTYHVSRWAGKMRQVRSEGRESMIKVLIVLLLNFNPRRMLSGIPNGDGSWRGIRVEEIARRAELPFTRVKEALRNLEAMNILWIGKQRREFDKDTSQWRGFPVIRAFKFNLFFALKLNKKLDNARILRPENDEYRVLVAPKSTPDIMCSPDFNASKMRSASDILDSLFR